MHAYCRHSAVFTSCPAERQSIEMNSRSRKKRRMLSRERQGSTPSSALAIKGVLVTFMVVGVMQSEAFNTHVSHQRRPSAPSTIPSRRAYVGLRPRQMSTNPLMTKSNGHLEEVSVLLQFWHLALKSFHSRFTRANAKSLQYFRGQKISGNVIG